MPGTDPGTILIVGATGRVGRMLARYWESAPPDAPVLFQTRGAERPGWVRWAPVDGALPPGMQVSAMVVLAGVTPGDGARLGENAAIAEACLGAARRAGITRVLYASSQAVYGAPRGRPFSEMDAPRPASDYGRAKLAAEAACDTARAGGPEVCVLRIGNVAGADMLLLNAANATPEAPVRLDRFTDGRGPRRSYIAADALARVIVALARIPDLPPVLNVAAPAPVAMEALLSEAGVPWEFAPAPGTAVQDVTVDAGALASHVPFEAHDSDPAHIVRVWSSTRDPA